MTDYPPLRKIGVLTRSMGGRLVGGNRYESSLERDFMLLMAWDLTVARISPQPVRIPVQDPSALRKSYTPDVLVEWLPGDGVARPAELVEVKYREAFVGEWRSWRAIGRAAQSFAAERGWKFRFATETEVRTAKLANVRRLMPYRRRQANPDAVAALRCRLQARGPMAVVDLVPETEEPTRRAAMLNALWCQLATSTFRFEVDQLLTPRTVISLAGATHG